jgi:DNA-binding winged helix-turn-helix (wHTH) protein
MAPDDLNYRFGEFLLDVSNRQLWRGESRIDLNARYFDALALMVREHGQLVHKERFFQEVWGDVVVSDSALTQCIKDIRKGLGEDAAHPRYVQTVHRFGYRFIGGVEPVPPGALSGDARTNGSAVALAPPAALTPIVAAGSSRVLAALQQGVAGMLGGGVAGVIGGLLYGFAIAYAPAESGPGAASILLVLIALNVVVGLAGGLGVSFGMAAARLAAPGRLVWSIAGAALGGMLVGGMAKLLGVDAFNLLFGHAPAGITGGMEGAVLGAAVALGTQAAGGAELPRRWRPVVAAGLAGAAAGVLITLAGGRLMGGSLELLARSFAESRLQLDALGHFFGELHFGHTAQVVLGGVEGFLFGSCVAGAIVLARHGRVTALRNMLAG